MGLGLCLTLGKISPLQVRYFQTAAHRLDGCVAVRTACRWTVFNEQPVAGERDVWRKTAEKTMGAVEPLKEEKKKRKDTKKKIMMVMVMMMVMKKKKKNI